MINWEIIMTKVFDLNEVRTDLSSFQKKKKKSKKPKVDPSITAKANELAEKICKLVYDRFEDYTFQELNVSVRGFDLVAYLPQITISGMNMHKVGQIDKRHHKPEHIVVRFLGGPRRLMDVLIDGVETRLDILYIQQSFFSAV